MTARTSTANWRSESGMTLYAIMAIMAVTTVVLLAAAPLVQQEIQRELELESIRRGEEVANAIREYVVFHNGTKLPESIDDLLEGLPQGTKKRMILRPSAATDPLSEDGKWRLIKADPQTLASFAKRVQDYNNGLLPPNPAPQLDRFSMIIVNSINTGDDSDTTEPDEITFDNITDNQPFIGVGSQSRNRSVIAYYGIENHSKWIFTPLFRGGGSNAGPQRPQGPQRPGGTLQAPR